jgi:hypothetical protein
VFDSMRDINALVCSNQALAQRERLIERVICDSLAGEHAELARDLPGIAGALIVPSAPTVIIWPGFGWK